MYVEGYSNQAIHSYIQTCFGGDETFAQLLRKVALAEESVYVLMQYVGVAPSNHELNSKS